MLPMTITKIIPSVFASEYAITIGSRLMGHAVRDHGLRKWILIDNDYTLPYSITGPTYQSKAAAVRAVLDWIAKT